MINTRNRIQRKGFPPSAFIIGSQKAGTTFLADMLGQHPEVILANPKEPGYFSGNYNKGEEWYKSCFVNSAGVIENKVLLDASTSYTMAPLDYSKDIDRFSQPLVGVPQRIHEFNPDSKLIYVVRNPTERTYSAYWHNVRAGHENRGFRQAIHESSIYLRTSNYLEQLQQYYRYFHMDQVEVILFDDLINAPLEACSRCCRFIGVSASFVPNIEKKNQGYVYKGVLQKVNEALGSVGGVTPLIKKISSIAPQFVKNIIGNVTVKKIPPINHDDKDYLDKLFQPNISELEKRLKLDLTKWK